MSISNEMSVPEPISNGFILSIGKEVSPTPLSDVVDSVEGILATATSTQKDSRKRLNVRFARIPVLTDGAVRSTDVLNVGIEEGDEMSLEGIVAASQSFFMTQGDNIIPKGMKFTIEALRSPDGDDVIPTKPRDTFDEAVSELSAGKNTYETPEKSPNISILIGRPEDGFWTHTFEFNRKDKEMLFVIDTDVVLDRQELFDDLVVYLAAFNPDVPTSEVLQMVQNNPLYTSIKAPSVDEGAFEIDDDPIHDQSAFFPTIMGTGTLIHSAIVGKKAASSEIQTDNPPTETPQK